MKIVKTTLFLLLTTLMACTKNDKPEEGYMTFKDGENLFTCNAAGGSKTITIFSNITDWKLVPEDTTQNWVKIWPLDGDDDGNVTFTVGSYDSAYPRSCIINLVADNKVITTYTVKQTGKPAYIIPTLTSLNQNVPMEAGNMTIKIRSNVIWATSVTGNEGEDISWITLGEKTDTTQYISFSDNSGSPLSRKAKIRFSMVGGDEEYYVDVNIKQMGATTYETSRNIGISSLLSSLTFDAEGIAEIEENYRIDAWITSNMEKGNFPDTSLYIQDASGRGLLIDFKDSDQLKNPSEAGFYDCGKKLSIHAIGLKFKKNEDGALRIIDFTSASVKSSTSVVPSAGLAVNISSLADLNNYENTLVNISPVEFTIPVGTYVNISDQSKALTGTTTSADKRWISASDDYKKLNNHYYLYTHIVRDKLGNSIGMNFNYSFTQKWSSLVPEGSGTITAVVTKSKNNNTLVIRDLNDIQISNSYLSRITNTLVKFGPYLNSESSPYYIARDITATVGNGSIIYSVPNSNGSFTCGISSSGYYMYWLYGVRVFAEEPASTIAKGYGAINAKSWYGSANTNSLVSTSENPYEAFILTTQSLKNAKGGDLYISFTTASSLGGPAHMYLEWAEDESSTNWQTIADYNSTGYEISAQYRQVNIKLPAAMKGKEKVVIRFRAKNKENANFNGNDLTSGGTNRLGTVEICEIK